MNYGKWKYIILIVPELTAASYFGVGPCYYNKFCAVYSEQILCNS